FCAAGFRTSMAQYSAKIDPQTAPAARSEARAAGEPAVHQPFAPISQFMERADRSGRPPRVLPRRLLRHVRTDPHVLLAFAVAGPTIVVESVVGTAPTELAVAAGTLLIAGQVGLSTWRRSPSWLPAVRLAAALAFVVF